ncbi:MAG: glutamyl-tRNA reductase [Verrucomicrobiia bacterium]
MNLYCLGLSHQSASVEERERVALDPTTRAQVTAHLRKALPGAETAVLSTCNRVEFLIAADAGLHVVRAAVADALRAGQKPVDCWERHEFVHVNGAAVHHTFAVAAGLQSMVVGETEIFGQVKAAYEEAKTSGSCGRVLHRLFQMAFAAAKEARTHSAITRGSVSVGSVAVELAERIFGELTETAVMILGAGETSERVLRTLVSRSVKSVLVSNRSHGRAVELAATVGGEAHRWEDWNRLLPEVDIIISSTAAPHHVLGRADVEPCMERRDFRPLFLIDLAVPRDIDPAVALVEAVYLYDIDDLQSIAQTNLREREREVGRCRSLLQKHEIAFAGWFDRTFSPVGGGWSLPTTGDRSVEPWRDGEATP